MFEQLKSETKTNHVNLEKIFISRIRNIHTKKEYGNFLGNLFDFYEPVELKIQNHLTKDILPDIDSRRKVNHLIRDMESVDCSHQRKKEVAGPTIDSLSSAAGALYVLEGSTHGGPYIAKMIQQQIEIPFSSLTYFNGYGENNGERWDYFKSSFENKACLFNIENMIKSANQTFSTLQSWLEAN